MRVRLRIPAVGNISSDYRGDSTQRRRGRPCGRLQGSPEPIGYVAGSPATEGTINNNNNNSCLTPQRGRGDPLVSGSLTCGRRYQQGAEERQLGRHVLSAEGQQAHQPGGGVRLQDGQTQLRAHGQPQLTTAG